MTDLLPLLTLLLLISVGVSAFFVALSALFPKRLAQTRTVADLMPGRAALVGVVNFLFFGVLGVVLGSVADRAGNDFLRGLLTLPAMLCVAGLAVGGCFGLAAVTQLVGQRLAPARPDYQRVILGALVLGWGGAVPGVGWFLLLPYAIWLGLGAFIISFVYRGRAVAG